MRAFVLRHDLLFWRSGLLLPFFFFSSVKSVGKETKEITQLICECCDFCSAFIFSYRLALFCGTSGCVLISFVDVIVILPCIIFCIKDTYECT